MTTTAHHADATALHHEPPEMVAGRQVLGVWLFIAGDAVVVGSLVFTYLYLRGLNTLSQWMPKGVHGASDLLAWGIVAAAAASAAAVWAGEDAIRRQTGGRVGLVLAGTVLALGSLALVVVAIRNIPQAVNATSGVRQIAGSYASGLLAIDVSNLIHLVVLALLGVGVAVRTSKGRISAQAPTHARLVRIYWVWVVVSMAISAALTTIFVASPK